MLCFVSVLQVLNLVQTRDREKCTTLKNVLATLTAIVDDLFSVGNQRVELFKIVLEILSGICTISEVDVGQRYICSSLSRQ